MDELITLNEAAEICGFKRENLYRWAKNGRLVIYKKGSRSFVKRADIERIKNENEEIKPLYPNK